MKEKKENDNNGVYTVTSNNEVTVYRELIAYFNTKTTFKKIDKLNKVEQRHLEKALELFGEERIKECFLKAEKSDFLSGRKDSEWSADFGWIIKPRHIASILNGKYEDYKYSARKQKNSTEAENTNSSFDADEFLQAALARTFDGV